VGGERDARYQFAALYAGVSVRGGGLEQPFGIAGVADRRK